MRRMLLHHQGPIERLDLSEAAAEDSPPGTGEVRLKIRACGVCHTDLHIAEGDLPAHRLPVVLGHQIVGVVDAVGADVANLKRGDRAGVGWLYDACGACAACLRGEENLCPGAQFTGYDADGGYAEAVTVAAAFTYPIPSRFDDAEAAPLLCAGIIGYRSLRRAEVQRGERIGLYGFGASAHLALQAAAHWGCAVAVATRGPAHRDLARRLGAAWIGGVDEPPPWPLDRAIVFAPSGEAVRRALEAVRPGGTVAINAIHLDALPELPYRILYGERTLRSVTNFTRRDALEFLGLAAAIPMRVEFELFPLAAAREALVRMKRRELRAAAVLAP
ncbi:MAG: zinc-dependent alcohol dehydrogenase family protein [Planctomycetes bacterium]|nr:zinc-dependent alcohol dehydrogenase family protein [Planctomycetota bacterium]